MKSIRIFNSIILLVLVLLCFVEGVFAQKEGWLRKETDLRLSGGNRIKAIRHPKDKAPGGLYNKKEAKRLGIKQKRSSIRKTQPAGAPLTTVGGAPVSVNVIDSPGIAGFVPWITVLTSDEKGAELELVAVPDSTVNYSRLTAADPSRDYTIGIFDTGASALVMGYTAATDAGLYSLDMVTDNEVRLTGVTGWVDANISYPLGVFIDGLNAIDPNGLLTDVSGMMGETNVAIVVGQDNGPDIPDLPTAIGTPLSVYYTTAFYNDQPVIRTHKNKTYRAPKIDIYTQTDGSIPSYPNTIPLELRPLGGVSVQYTPNLEDIMEILEAILGGGEVNFDEPGNPSIIIGNLSQSIFFVHSVDLQDNGNSATDKDRFMYDTGAQVTVIGSRVGARLGLDRASREFVVEIEGVDGTSIDADGFYIDSLDIPAMGQWLKFTDVPVILLDVFSAEGGTVDGIIGMNLFTELNFVLHGGGLFLHDDPKVEFEFVDSLPLLGDVAPDGGNGVVDIADLRVFIEAWLGTLDPQSANWNPDCDIAPKYTPDGVVNLLDFVLFAQEWQSGTE